jgi:hypothetical protein
LSKHIRITDKQHIEKVSNIEVGHEGEAYQRLLAMSLHAKSVQHEPQFMAKSLWQPFQ